MFNINKKQELCKAVQEKESNAAWWNFFIWLQQNTQQQNIYSGIYINTLSSPVD